ncbi:MAG TPA: reverse transcriptase/maturase family protein [Ignavibacteria bacterium]
MKKFETYFSEQEILRQLCKIRVKIAKNRCKKHLLNSLTTNPKYNYHRNSVTLPKNKFEEYQQNLVNHLSQILPPRNKWVKLGEESRRKPQKTNEFLTSNDKNFYSLLKTIKVHKKKNSQEKWYLNLQNFIQEIKFLSTDESYKVETPIIFPKLKDPFKKDGENDCRPICIFSLKDRIILSLTNKFLTQLFDKYFQDSSYAFRSKKNEENKILSHHDCIKDILKYKDSNKEQKLFVVECDMKKFYDTVNHRIAEYLFDELTLKSKIENPKINLDTPVRIFKSYLYCYAFNNNIPKRTDIAYWESYKIPNGIFTWVDEMVTEHYNEFSTERIGVPQGGALSGLIANIYLNQADIELSKTTVFYQRFCDDMIIIHNNLTEIKQAKYIYKETLKRLKLFPHNFKNADELVLKGEDVKTKKNNYKPFWSGKSKGPYKWGEITDNGFPWIGFVGYEINIKGEIRIRKKSLEKELKKQKTIIKEIEKAILVGMRKPKGTATESAINRLIGMSVGRIGLDNFEEVSTDMCWKNGFKELTINEHSIRQIKLLDRNRSKLYYKFLKTAKEPDFEPIGAEDRQIIKYNKPFSYYYQILERQKKAIG